MKKRKREFGYFSAATFAVAAAAVFGLSADAAPCIDVISAQESSARSILGIPSALTSNGSVSAVTDLTESSGAIPIIVISSVLAACAVAVIIAVLHQDGSVPKKKRERNAHENTSSDTEHTLR